MALQPSELSVLPDDVDLDRDRALVKRCQSGDSSAFGELYARYYARVYRFCFRRLHDHEEAEDVAQDAFARAWRALPNFAGDRRFYPWLTVIADNRCRDIQRRRARSTPTADVDLVARQATEPTGTDTPEDALIASVEGDLAVQALGRLSARHRDVLKLREGSGLTYQEIARLEGVEIRTVESLIWRARQALKREYATIASVNTVIGGFALGRWGALRRVGGSVARRLHPVAPLLGTTGGTRGLAAGVALTSFAFVAAAMPGAGQPAHHPAAAVAPTAAAATPGVPALAGWADPGVPVAPPWPEAGGTGPGATPTTGGEPVTPAAQPATVPATPSTTPTATASSPAAPSTAAPAVPGGTIPATTVQGLTNGVNQLVAGASGLIGALVPPLAPPSAAGQPSSSGVTVPPVVPGSTPITVPTPGLLGGS
ncbi:MAG TPA: RNA polymerase sigma factor [Acidimicrobiales bacterium]